MMDALAKAANRLDLNFEDIKNAGDILGKGMFDDLNRLKRFDPQALIEQGEALGVVITPEMIDRVNAFQAAMGSASQEFITMVAKLSEFDKAAEAATAYMNKLRATGQTPKGYLNFSQAKDEVILEELKALEENKNVSIEKLMQNMRRDYDAYVAAMQKSAPGITPIDFDEFKANKLEVMTGVTPQQLADRVKALYSVFKEDESAWARKITPENTKPIAKPLLENYMYGAFKELKLTPAKYMQPNYESTIFRQAKVSEEDKLAMNIVNKLNKISIDFSRSLTQEEKTRMLSAGSIIKSNPAEALRQLEGMSSGLPSSVETAIANILNDIKKLKPGSAIPTDEDILRTAGVSDNQHAAALEFLKRMRYDKSFPDMQKAIESIRQAIRGMNISKEQAKNLQEALHKTLEDNKKKLAEAIDNAFEGLNKSASAVKVENSTFGDISNVVKTIADSIGMLPDDMLKQFFRNWKQANSNRQFATEAQEKEAFFEEFFGDKLLANIDAMLKNLDRALGTNASSKVNEIMNRLKDRKKDALEALAMSIFKDADKLKEDIDAMYRKRVGLPTDFRKQAMQRNGVTQQQYDANASVRAAVDKDADMLRKQAAENLKGSFTDKARELKYQALAEQRGEREAEKIRARDELQSIKGGTLSKQQANLSDAMIDVKFDKAELARLLAEPMKSANIYTNELSRKGGWQGGVAVQRDDAWKDRVDAIAKLQDKIFQTESAIYKAVGE